MRMNISGISNSSAKFQQPPSFVNSRIRSIHRSTQEDSESPQILASQAGWKPAATALAIDAYYNS